MIRRSDFEHRDSGWQGLVWASGAAALVILVLAAGVALAWAVGRGPASTPSLQASAPQTPTPRTLSFAKPSSPTPAAADSVATANITVEEPQDDAAEMVVVATPALMEMAIEDEPAAGADDLILEASSEDDFRDLAQGSWSAAAGKLVNPGSDAVSERWIPVATAPGPSFAVDAEIRVVGRLDAVCDQSFGIAGGSPAASLVFGGGVIYPCEGGSSLARLTDVTAWENGYNGDPLLAEEPFKPGEKWRTYRFELRDGRVRLLVDGEEVVDAAADPGIDPAATDVEVGFWSQGVGLEIRKLTVRALPA